MVKKCFPKFAKVKTDEPEKLVVERLMILLDHYKIKYDNQCWLRLAIALACDKINNFDPWKKAGATRKYDDFGDLVVYFVDDIIEQKKCTIRAACLELSREKGSPFYGQHCRTLANRYSKSKPIVEFFKNARALEPLGTGNDSVADESHC